PALRNSKHRGVIRPRQVLFLPGQTFLVLACLNRGNRLHGKADFMNRKELIRIAKDNGTPVVVIDHDQIRRNYAEFTKHLPKVQAYYAVKANPAPEIINTLYKAGASFDVASLPEFMTVYENIRHLSARKQQDFIWDKI